MAQRILVIDDDLFIRELYIDVLRSKGYDVDSAVNGEEGLAKLKKGGYDLALLDVMMPGLDGLGVLKELNQNPPQQKNGSIILLTNLDQDPLIKDAIGKGATSYFVKANLTPDQLLLNVSRFLNTGNVNS